MAERLIFDTTFLIDVQRERRQRSYDGPAHAFLKSHADVEMAISVITFGEFIEGFTNTEHEQIKIIERTHTIFPIDATVARSYAKTAKHLRRTRQLIGTNDMWIASTAIAHGLPLVTANQADFRRISEIELVDYRGQ